MAIEHTFLYKNNTQKTKLLTPLKAIREYCLMCSIWNVSEVAKCPAKDCALYIFRSGKDASKKRDLTEAQRKEIGKRFSRHRDP